jgi:hypothetical protein
MQTRLQSLACTDRAPATAQAQSPGSGNEKPRPGEEKAGALRDGKRRGAPGGISVQTPLNAFREERDVIQVTFLRVPRATVSKRVNSSKADADDDDVDRAD